MLVHALIGDNPNPSFWERVLYLARDAGIKLLIILIIIAVAFLASWILRLVIRRVVSRIVNGAKNKANVDDTQALERSPLAAVRLVQRTRTLGSILQNIVNVTIVIIALVLIVNVINQNVLGSFALLHRRRGSGRHRRRRRPGPRDRRRRVRQRARHTRPGRERDAVVRAQR